MVCTVDYPSTYLESNGSERVCAATRKRRWRDHQGTRRRLRRRQRADLPQLDGRCSVGVQSAPRDEGSLPVLALMALLAGGASGLICAGFRLALIKADHFREAVIARAHVGGLVGFVLVTASAALAVASAAWLVRRFSPYASGSGIPQVEAALDEQLPPAPPHLILVKFFGGLLAIGSGLALGREGPSVQMGAVIAHIVGRMSGRGWQDRKALLAAGAGAGLAVAFNAPIAGAIFVFEELVRRFDMRAIFRFPTDSVCRCRCPRRR